ncbi:SGNH/GDSL hydrolase family protein [Nonomuraea rubra]|uniref:SGNH/GDSL hydrolase family protein n=1 Tax=Nonomuraea rubra TaxID=46180 RepID=UPI0033C20075
MLRNVRLRPVQRLIVTATALLGTCASVAATGPAASAEAGATGTHYVALGDSYATGYGTTPIVDAACGRAKKNLPYIVNLATEADSYQNVACAGAATADVLQARNGRPAQLDALKPDTNLVTVSIGGNDLGFTSIAVTCATVSQRQPTGDPCRQSFRNADGSDKLQLKLDAIEPEIAKVVTEVKKRSPRAMVALTGYPSLVPDSGQSCRSAQVPFADGDFAYLRDTTVRLNRAIAEQARNTGAKYIDLYTPSIGHDMCATGYRRWIEPLLTEQGSIAPAAAHPNSQGILGLGSAFALAILEYQKTRIVNPA